ncbi:ATP-binding protein [Luteolibacter marinus]|uniref:ATP-binding protein n=1 Tax=Luteolibacter marinus TaxID=2776705 RepID=UPI001865FBF9|nr:ATP-binding protein [Luteolibacter marinus]
MISIRWRLTILLCLAVGVLFVVSGIGVFLALRDVLNRQFDATLTAKARALVTASEIDGGDFEIDLTVKDFEGFGKGGEDYFEIRRLGGELFDSSPSLRKGKDAPGAIHDITEPTDDEPKLRGGSLGDGTPVRLYVQRFYPKDDKQKEFEDLYLIVASPTRGLQQQLGRFATILAVAGVLTLLLMVPIIRAGLGHGLRPLNKLTKEIRGIPPDGLRQRLATDPLPSELVPVAERLNQWIARLEESFERERRFSSDAAHELRTPLAEMRAMAELGSMWPEEATTERCAAIVTVADELTSLLDKLVLLARADAGVQPFHLEVVELQESLESAVMRVRDQADEREIHIDLAVTDGAFRTDPVLWNAIVQNLLGNAVAHAPAGTVVTVDATPRRLVVRNLAPELSEDDLPQLFERFWRKDPSRSGYGHSGLGMSIVRACANLLGGRCRASLTPGGELEVEVAWPSE